MLIWIVILVLWIALTSLILHDATKTEPNGSAVVLAARKINLWIRRTIRKSRRASRPQQPKADSPKPVLKVVNSSVSAVASTAQAAPQGGAMMQEQTPAKPKKRKWWSKESRAEIAGPDLEAAISDAVRRTASCEDFIGVFVVRKTPKSNGDPNWEVQGARFGKADRQLAEQTLAEVVQRMQQEVLLADDRKESASQPTSGRTIPLDNVRPQFEGSSHKTAAKG